MSTGPDVTSMALFCDFENIALGVRDANYEKFDIGKVLERLLLKGSIVVKKAYCDWDRYKAFKAPMHEASFELIEIPHVRQSGKNSADIRMVVDALDLCYTKAHVETFVIISGDSDFSPLVSKLRENNKQVIGVGVKNSTSDLLIANCDEFIFYDDLVRERKKAAAKRASGRAAPSARAKGARSAPAANAGAPAAAEPAVEAESPPSVQVDAAAVPEAAAPEPAVPETAAETTGRKKPAAKRVSSRAAASTRAKAARATKAAGGAGAGDTAASAPAASPEPAEVADAPPPAEAAAAEPSSPAERDPEQRKQQAIDIIVSTVEALATERGGDERIWGSMVKQAMKRVRPGFNESFYGFRSFNGMLEEAERRGSLVLERDEKSGGYIVRLAGSDE